eukprot:scaffold1323_cov255-Pinguiococcus_pyrenoidosus.AAC.1
MPLCLGNRSAGVVGVLRGVDEGGSHSQEGELRQETRGEQPSLRPLGATKHQVEDGSRPLLLQKRRSSREARRCDATSDTEHSLRRLTSLLLLLLWNAADSLPSQSPNSHRRQMRKTRSTLRAKTPVVAQAGAAEKDARSEDAASRQSTFEEGLRHASETQAAHTTPRQAARKVGKHNPSRRRRRRRKETFRFRVRGFRDPASPPRKEGDVRSYAETLRKKLEVYRTWSSSLDDGKERPKGSRSAAGSVARASLVASLVDTRIKLPNVSRSLSPRSANESPSLRPFLAHRRFWTRTYSPIRGSK